jgi:hypothetical protein
VPAYTNRAAAHLQLEQWQDAVDDCAEALKLLQGAAGWPKLFTQQSRCSWVRPAVTSLAAALWAAPCVLRFQYWLACWCCLEACGMQCLVMLTSLGARCPVDADACSAAAVANSSGCRC